MGVTSLDKVPVAQREEMVARLCAADSLLGLMGPLVRVTPAMLLEVCTTSERQCSMVAAAHDS